MSTFNVWLAAAGRKRLMPLFDAASLKAALSDNSLIEQPSSLFNSRRLLTTIAKVKVLDGRSREGS